MTLKYRSALLMTGFALATIPLAILLRGHAVRKPAGTLAQDNRNIQILESIPLVKNLENPAPDEPEITSELIDLFDRFADRNANSDGTRNRGTHAKGKCFRGELEILGRKNLLEMYGNDRVMVDRLKQGLWSYDGKFPAVIRFANADGMGRRQADTVPDVRGFSFSVQGPSELHSFIRGGRQDFMMNSTPEFASGGIHEFLEIVKLANVSVYHDLSYLPNPLYIPAALHDASLITQGNADGGNLRSYAHTEYWSNLPYTHGMDRSGGAVEIVKYKATPCDGRGTERLSDTRGLGPDYLQSEIVDEARAGTVCMLIQVQFFSLDAVRANASGDQLNWTVSDWMENGGLLWDERTMPFFTVGRVTIPRASDGSSPEISCDDQYINTRLHSNPANQPIGSIARVRTLVEENSRARRMGN